MSAKGRHANTSIGIVMHGLDRKAIRSSGLPLMLKMPIHANSGKPSGKTAWMIPVLRNIYWSGIHPYRGIWNPSVKARADRLMPKLWLRPLRN